MLLFSLFSVQLYIDHAQVFVPGLPQFFLLPAFEPADKEGGEGDHEHDHTDDGRDAPPRKTPSDTETATLRVCATDTRVAFKLIRQTTLTDTFFSHNSCPNNNDYYRNN